MGPFVLAWLVGEGIIVYRSVKKDKAPPGPGQLLLASGLFVMLGLLAEAPRLRPLATTLAWGFDIAAFMNLYGVGGPSGEAGKAGSPNWPPPKVANTILIPTGKASDNQGTADSGVVGRSLGP